MARHEISNTDDVIDSRDVIARIAELEADLDRDEDEAVELAALRKLAAEAEGYAADWHHGATLIRESHFTEYQQEMCADCGYIPLDFPSWIEIDWDTTARNLKQDYTEVDYDGVTYLIR